MVTVEAVSRAGIAGAIEFGVGLSGSLLDYALREGMAPDAPALVERMMETFRKQDRTAAAWGLSAEEQGEVWRTLLDLAWEYEISVSADLASIAWAEIGLNDDNRAAPGAGLDKERSEEWTEQELSNAARNPSFRCHVAKECCRRGDEGALEVLGEALRRMPEAEVVEVLPDLGALGDQAGDLMIDLLTARSAPLRHIAALILGASGLRRGGSPLVTALMQEPTELWRELARIIGKMGGAVTRGIGRALKDPMGQEDRLAYVVAHLAAAGQEKAVVRWESSDDARVASIALRAGTLKQEIFAHLQALEDGSDAPEGIERARNCARLIDN
jgi:hypothetical protein